MTCHNRRLWWSACAAVAAACMLAGCAPRQSAPSTPQVSVGPQAGAGVSGRGEERLPSAAEKAGKPAGAEPSSGAGPAEVEKLLAILAAVGPHGAGHVEAAEAWRRLARAPSGQLPTMLEALDEANPLAANWIRTAIDAASERALAEGRSLPEDQLERFVLDRTHAPRARRLAYELLCRVDPAAPERLLPGMLDDPSLELRRDAVARLISQAESLPESQSEQAKAIYRRALQAARDLDQVKLLAQRLRKLGETVDLARHFGFVVRWKVIGPFDNTARAGFARVYPPEREIDFAATYEGKHGPVRWQDVRSTDEYGKLDFNQVLGEEKEVVAYAASEFYSAAEQDVEIRFSTPNAVKLWLNGRVLAAYEVYHSGAEPDQYVARVRLQSGRNVILLKVCQNEQTQEWARVWQVQLRVCDEQGTAVLSTDREPAPAP